MGSGASKGSSPADPSPPAAPRRVRSRVFGASCFGLPSTLADDLEDDEEENGSIKGNTDEIGSKEINGRSRKLRTARNRKMPPPLSLSDVDQNGEGDDRESGSLAQVELGSSSSSSSNANAAAISSNPPSRSRSRFGFIPDRIGFRLSRTVSLGSTRAQSMLSESISVQNSERADHVIESSCNDVDNHNENEENSITGTHSSQDIVQNSATVGSVGGHSSRRNRAESGNDGTRQHNRRSGPQEPLEGSVRFSRTLSVGRLRDRVLRRNSSSAEIFGAALLEDRSETAYSGQVSERRAQGGRRRVPPASGNEVWPDYARSHPFHIASMTDSSYDPENGSSQLREGSNNDLLEHRSAFLERRRRIRSQVRALQRLGSRFENLSGHERSCILSGQHRTGRCTCRASNRAANPNDETGTRASISRIVMLAEALFEVLDEIHQQSEALTSRPSFSSIGSVPAPKEVVEGMPVKVYMKPHKHQNEEAAQCYICLVEYEDRDFMRILPCNHEFHRACIDKWLKEIHRVCPLCRGDVCRPETLGAEKFR